MRFLRRVFVGLFLVALTAALLAQVGCQIYGAVSEAMPQEPRDIRREQRAQIVETVPYGPDTVVPVMTAYGELRAPLGGVALETGAALAKGGRVEAGEMLLEIDPVGAEAALARVEADLSEARAAERDAERGL